MNKKEEMFIEVAHKLGWVGVISTSDISKLALTFGEEYGKYCAEQGTMHGMLISRMGVNVFDEVNFNNWWDNFKAIDK